MTGTEDPPPLLVGALALPDRVEVSLVERTPFGRLRAGARRLVEDADALGPAGSLALAPGPSEDMAGDAWIGTIANAVAKLTFGLPAQRLVLGLAVDGELDPERGELTPAGLFSPIANVEERLAKALRGRHMEPTSPPRAVPLAEAWYLGERHSALGALVDIPLGVVLVWDRVAWWVSGDEHGERVRSAPEPSFGFEGLDRSRRGAGGPVGAPKPLLTAARRGDPDARALLRGAAERLAREAGERLERLGPGARLVLAGTLGRAGQDDRLARLVRVPFEAVLDSPSVLPAGEGRAASAVVISHEAAAPAIGAVAHALDASTHGEAP